MKRAGSTNAPPMEALLNLARYHREHEKYYAIAPLRDAEVILRASRTLKALADRWSRAQPLVSTRPAPAYSGCEDLNDTTAIETSGVLFMEGAGEPAELIRLREDLRARAEGSQQTGSWLAEAMGTSWESAGALLHIPHLADLLGERHRIIVNNWLAASMSQLMATLVQRAADILDVVDFTPDAVRADLTGPRTSPGYLYSAAELLDRAADLAVISTTLTRDSEPAWRAWQARVEAIRDSAVAPGPAEPQP